MKWITWRVYSFVNLESCAWIWQHSLALIRFNLVALYFITISASLRVLLSNIYCWSLIKQSVYTSPAYSESTTNIFLNNIHTSVNIVHMMLLQMYHNMKHALVENAYLLCHSCAIALVKALFMLMGNCWFWYNDLDVMVFGLLISDTYASVTSNGLITSICLCYNQGPFIHSLVSKIFQSCLQFPLSQIINFHLHSIKKLPRYHLISTLLHALAITKTWACFPFCPFSSNIINFRCCLNVT